MKSKNLILACSGASNTGAYTDQIARKLMKDGNAKMLCLARFAVDNKFVEHTKKNIEEFDEVFILDGCPINCAEKIAQKLSVNEFKHFNVTDYGIEKGETPVTEEKINEICERIFNN